MSRRLVNSTCTWSAIVLFVVVFLITISMRSGHYQGKEIRLSVVDNDLQIATSNNTPVTIEAYSSSYFLFEKDKTIIFATPIEPGLNWAYNYCFYMKAEITPGNWQESYGGDNILISIKSQEDISLIVIPDSNKIVTTMLMIGFVMWVIGLGICFYMDDKYRRLTK